MYFFGHKDAPETIETDLKSVLTELIKNKKVDMFYVGNHGNFDFTVKRVLKQLKIEYPHIDYAVVLAYMPTRKYFSDDQLSKTLFPDGLENTPSKYAVVKRNRWMIDRADYVVTYVKHIGGALSFKKIAEKRASQ